MFGKKPESKLHGRIDSLIGAGTRIEGALYFTGGLRVDGELKGSVQAAEGASSSTLVLSEHARIEGAVSVAHMVTNGTVVGPVVVTEALEMQSRARIVGDVEYATIEMHQGAVIEGRLVNAVRKAEELKPPELA
ncbi:polymer-forming cytoskeletal protein [Dechloromonas sp. XY25]|uniref:Polymer-forming cytoskeletal protein n=1 Tax=Dechloromonas hankyongensis TaxID=2908002 RepID=A0ABS9K5J7_9RHOO|nr:polymer-forming cytoskeletal protein [Dechloromonas hankyongensis]MCG2578423.1 polymer-forming cytoskeletal protein [Dechloromonas hankyongensis]